ncbi:LuxR C-terminal-related transcriptional regulator [Escherichia coli]|uniref:LuxR C-terminal-related transcriptional regulator n=1 Tax=Escherichia coli TaxID=562 RepID=UPI00201CEA8D|nr:LuxR C-terminal-related transcriptional regulator [Escherichia coli]
MNIKFISIIDSEICNVFQRPLMRDVRININLVEYDAILDIEFPYLLSEIEELLLHKLLQGYSMNDISRQRNRSIKTISCKKIKLYKKLGVKNDLTLWRDIFLSSKSKSGCNL